jgi:hypothetical protein
MKRPAVAIGAAVLALVAMAAQGEASVNPVLTPSSGTPVVGYPNVNITYSPISPTTTFIVIDWRDTDLTPLGKEYPYVDGTADGIDVSVHLLTSAGQEYLITFAKEEITPAVEQNEPVHATVVSQNGNTPAQPFQPDPTDQVEWVTEGCYPFQAASAHSTLTFFCERTTDDAPSCYRVSAVAIPEPAMVIIWSLLGATGWLGMRIARRGRRVGRQPWSNENRAAILEIIAKR